MVYFSNLPGPLRAWTPFVRKERTPPGVAGKSDIVRRETKVKKTNFPGFLPNSEEGMGFEN